MFEAGRFRFGSECRSVTISPAFRKGLGTGAKPLAGNTQTGFLTPGPLTKHKYESSIHPCGRKTLRRRGGTIAGMAESINESESRYSARNASSGEIKLARMAGKMDASRPDKPSTTMATIVTMGSYGLMP
jgi:hypothetical protein